MLSRAGRLCGCKKIRSYAGNLLFGADRELPANPDVGNVIPKYYLVQVGQSVFDIYLIVFHMIISYTCDFFFAFLKVSKYILES